MREHAVVIVGGGPTGLMLAGELALASVDVAIIERRADQDLVGARASGLHSRTIEVLDQRGIADRFLSQGQVHGAVSFHVPLDISDMPSRHPYVLGLFQNHIERTLAGWVEELKVPTYRSREVTGFAQDSSGVDIQLADGESLRTEYLVGCDGGRSVIRKAAGIEFAGWDATTSWLIAEAETTSEPKWGWHHDALGSHAIGKSEDGRRARLVVTESEVVRDATAPTLRDVSTALVRVYGTDFGIHSPAWMSRFTDMARQAVTYRDRRVLLAGDAAHVHAPLGGQGLNVGVQDAVNLGWKLAQVVKGTSPESLLDTYHAERHPVAARVLKSTMATVTLRRPDAHIKAVGDYFAQLLSIDEARKRFAAQQAGLDICYDLARSDTDKAHPLLGRRMPDLDIITADGPLRVFTLLHTARPVLINFGPPGVFVTDRVRSIDAEYTGPWELPALGVVTAPAAVLVRPDGYVAWVGESSQQGLADASTTWFGRPAA
jgi:3-(3-hydroxy-phenyl)propionate hydroxylase